MQTLCLTEYESFPRSSVNSRVLQALQRYDEQQATTIFDWSRRNWVKARNLVGVVQIPGLQIEILPKIDSADPPTSQSDGSDAPQARQNLLFMLSESGCLSLHERDLASQQLQRHSLLEALIRAFAQRLLVELRRGQQHQYRFREENLSVVRGKILLSEHLRSNLAHRHRTYVGYDDFTNDTGLNRILKASCLRLLAMTRLSATQQHLREAVLELADVPSENVEASDFDEIHLDRGSERFRELLEFCRMLFQRNSPNLAPGQQSTFSLLVPMEVLFEEFIGALIRKHASRFGFSRSAVHLQASQRREWLLRDETGAGRFRLKPDVLVDGSSVGPRLLLDTKWKRLQSDDEDQKNGVCQADIYQLYAYAQRYRCQNNILLYPSVAGVTPTTYSLDGEDTPTRIKIRVIDLKYDIRKHQERFVASLAQVLQSP